MTEALLTPADLAAVFSVDERTVLEWRRLYSWPHVKLGRRFRWTPEQLEQIVRTHSVKAAEVERTDGRTHLSAARRRAF